VNICGYLSRLTENRLFELILFERSFSITTVNNWLQLQTWYGDYIITMV